MPVPVVNVKWVEGHEVTQVLSSTKSFKLRAALHLVHLVEVTEQARQFESQAWHRPPPST